MPEINAEIKVLLTQEKWEAAFTKIVSAYTQPLYWRLRKLVLNHADADDCLQNTFIQVWKHLPYYKGEAKVYTWLYRIATNEGLNHLRKQKKRLQSSESEARYVFEQLTADAFYAGDAAEKKLLSAVAKLPPKQQVVFKLKYFSEIKYEEMAEQLNTSVGALKASYHHAKQKIKEYLVKL